MTEQAKELEEWESHVRSPTPRRTWCGEWVGIGFYFVDADHALRSVAQCTYAQPCPACLEAIRREK